MSAVKCLLLTSSLVLASTVALADQYEDYDQTELTDNEVSPDQCGFLPISHRIVGGYTVDSVKYPWFVAQVLSNDHAHVHCGGTLITDRHVLSAAHCFVDDKGRLEDVQNYHARFAFVHRHSEDVDVVPFVDVDIHPSFDHSDLSGDIAIATLQRPVKHTPICLPEKDSAPEGEKGVVIGFGETEGRKISDTLQEATVKIFNRRQCKASQLPKSFLLPKTFCAGVMEGGTDSCQGDSGGPLQVRESEGNYVIQGIVSSGEGCAREGVPGVYTRVVDYLDWIQDHIDSPYLGRIWNVHI